MNALVGYTINTVENLNPLMKKEISFTCYCLAAVYICCDWKDVYERILFYLFYDSQLWENCVILELMDVVVFRTYNFQCKEYFRKFFKIFKYRPLSLTVLHHIFN